MNIDGRELYTALLTPTTLNYNYITNALIPVSVGNDTVGNSIPTAVDNVLTGMAAGPDPQTGKPVINAVWYDTTLPVWSDVHISVVDADTASPNFNTVIRTLDAGLGGRNVSGQIAVGPDGKFAYVWYSDRTQWYLGIMDLSKGAFTPISARTLGANGPSSITPDGKSLLLMTNRNNRARIKIFDISNPTRPKPVFEITPIPIPGHGFPNISNYQVVGDQLYAFDSSGIVVVFNFRRETGDFRERGWSILPIRSSFAFSADGAWLFVTDPNNDLVAVLDAGKLTTGKNLLLTNLRAPYSPGAIAVSPVPPPMKPVLNKHRGRQERIPPPARPQNPRMQRLRDE